MLYLTGNSLTYSQLYEFWKTPQKVQLTDSARKQIEQGHQTMLMLISTGSAPIYGINTGFGSLCNTTIPSTQLSQLQYNLLRSHAAGVGKEVPPEVVRLMLLLKIHALSQGYSGVSLQLVDRLLLMLNEDIIPVVFQQGSLGASGDLAPLAHLCLPLIGEGMVYYKNEKKEATEVLRTLNLSPITLGPKEGLALLNGTQFMSAYSLYALIQAHKLSLVADFIAALSLDVFDAREDPFDTRIAMVRKHPGQRVVSERISAIRKDSVWAKQPKKAVQDPYSFRCIPQVHGASYDVIKYAEQVFLTEFNAVTDNPLIFQDPEPTAISGGNFHGQPLALTLDFLCMALSELGSIAERRIFWLLAGSRGLPPFLTENPGVNSGLMIAQYTAAALASANKQLCTPASVDNIPSCNGQEDHVSMGANAATKLASLIENIWQLFGIEWLTSTTAAWIRNKQENQSPITLPTHPELSKLIRCFWKECPYFAEDTYLSSRIAKAVNFLKKTDFFVLWAEKFG